MRPPAKQAKKKSGKKKSPKKKSTPKSTTMKDSKRMREISKTSKGKTNTTNTLRNLKKVSGSTFHGMEELTQLTSHSHCDPFKNEII